MKIGLNFFKKCININIQQIDEFNIFEITNKENEFLNKNFYEYNNNNFFFEKNENNIDFSQNDKIFEKIVINFDEKINKNSPIKKNFNYNKDLENKNKNYLKITELENDYVLLNLRPFLIKKIIKFYENLIKLRKILKKKENTITKELYKFISRKYEIWNNFYNSTYILKFFLSRYNIEEKDCISNIFYLCILLMNFILIKFYNENYFLKNNDFFFFENGNFFNEKKNKDKDKKKFFIRKKFIKKNLEEYKICDFLKINVSYFSSVDIKKEISKYKLDDFFTFFKDLTNCQGILKSSTLKTFLKKKFELKYLLSIVNYYFSNYCFEESENIKFFFDDVSEETNVMLNFINNKYFLNDFSNRYFSHYYYIIQNEFFNIDKLYFLNREIKILYEPNFLYNNEKTCSLFENFLFEKIFLIISEYNIDGLNEFIKNFFIESVYSILIPGSENWFDFVNQDISMSDYFLQKTIKEKKYLTILKLLDNISFSYIEILKDFFLFDLDKKIMEKKKK